MNLEGFEKAAKNPEINDATIKKEFLNLEVQNEEDITRAVDILQRHRSTLLRLLELTMFSKNITKTSL